LQALVNINELSQVVLDSIDVGRVVCSDNGEEARTVAMRSETFERRLSDGEDSESCTIVGANDGIDRDSGCSAKKSDTEPRGLGSESEGGIGSDAA